MPGNGRRKKKRGTKVQRTEACFFLRKDTSYKEKDTSGKKEGQRKTAWRM